MGTRLTDAGETGVRVCQADANQVLQDLVLPGFDQPRAAAWVAQCRSGCHHWIMVGVEAGQLRMSAQLTLDDGEALAAHILQEVERVREAKLASAPPAPIPPLKKGPTND